MGFKKILTKKDMYTIFQDDSNNLLIMGKTQLGNDHIIDQASTIISELINGNSDDIKKQLIWLHGNGPSPHFILYTDKNNDNKIDNLQLECFVKSKCSKKSELDKQLSCCMLKDVKKTDIPGLVYVKHEKLSDLLEN